MSEVKTSCPHHVCETHSDTPITYSRSTLNETIARFFESLIRLLKLIGPFLTKYLAKYSYKFNIIFDEQSAHWNRSNIEGMMKQVVSYYKRFNIHITYDVLTTKGIKSQEMRERFRPIGNHTNIFLVDNFSDCPNCMTQGFWNGFFIKMRYFSKGAWIVLAHEIGHAFSLKHGGSTNNLMNEIGPSTSDPKRIKLTICQVIKIKS